MKILNITIGLMAVGAVSLTSCKDDYLDTVPTAQVSDVTISSSLDNIYVALNGIHKEMVSQESGYQCMGGEPGIRMCMDAEGDDMTWKSNTWMKAAYLGWQCNLNNTSGYNYTIWRLYYQWILNANKILESLDEQEDKTSDLYKQIRGEALCIRAWCHFQLVQTWAKRYDNSSDNSQAGVPYRTDSKGGELARSSVKETYDNIIKDLTEANTLLDDGLTYNLYKNGTVADWKNHYTDITSNALLARVYLVMQNYSEAATYAAKAISVAEGTYDCKLMSTEKELTAGFADITSSCNEALYSAMTPDDQTVYFYSFMAYMSWNFSSSAIRGGVKCINADTYNTMSETDIRRQWWDPAGTAAVPTKSYNKVAYQNRKFTARSTANAVCDFAFFRLAEMYLVEAEALARDGKNVQAQEVFKKFQITRDPSYAGTTATGDALATEIMNSRRIELWGEGFRFFDLKRLNQGMKRGSNFVVSFCTFLEQTADAQGWVWEIPKKETDYNSLCTKNY